MSGNKRLGARVLLSLCSILLGRPGQVQAYEPPIGIPAPSFGIEESIENIYGAGHYTHYIDSSHLNATDDDNPFGTADKPRRTIPLRMRDLPPGSVVEIRGGPYRFSAATQWTADGTREEPVFIRGADPEGRPLIIKSRVEIGGRYLIIENLELYDDSRISIHLDSPSHVAVRNCEIHGPEGAATFGAAVRARGEDIVVYNNHIHHNWKDNDIDVHGVKPGLGALRVWVLDNYIHHNSGDGVQACHNCDPPPQFVYIGRNIFHDDRENGVDLKYVKDIVISQNVLYEYRDASTSDGSAIVLGSDGAPNRPWVIFNEIFASRNGIRNEATDTAWIVGNKIYDIEGFAIGLEKYADDLYVIGNTIYNVGVGIDQFWRDTFRLHIFNNIFADIKGRAHLNIESGKVAAASQLGHNLFWQGGEPVYIRWGDGRDYGSTADLVGFAGGANNLIGDPRFVGAANFDLSLAPHSAAIDAGVPHGVYDDFVALHGVGIRLDFGGADRPWGSHWDIGAFEYVDLASTAVEEQGDVPAKYSLQSYPNPFNTTTTILFEMPRPGRALVEIVNIYGHKVAVLAEGHYAAGTYEVEWDGKDQDQRQAATGLYFYQLKTDGRILAKKMLLLK